MISRANYSFDNWRADGDDRDAAEVAATSPFRCDLLGCIGKVEWQDHRGDPSPAALEEDCRIADIVIAPFSVGKEYSRGWWSTGACCKPEGAHALYIEGLSIRSESVAETQG